MRRSKAPLLLCLVLPLGARGESSVESTPPAITVYTEFDRPPSAVTVETMRHELESIMGPLGLEFIWRDLHASSGSEVSVELVVVSFKGSCRMLDSLSPGGESGALGWTHMSDGTILPFSDVDCDKIRRFISTQVRSISSSEQETVFGRAVGRVLAHELYHIFTNTTRHASWGVAKAYYTARDLVADSFRFEEKDSRKLRTGKLSSLFRSRKPPLLGFTGSR